MKTKLLFLFFLIVLLGKAQVSQLDPTFNGNGKFFLDTGFNYPNNNAEYICDILEQPDEKIALLGLSFSSSGFFEDKYCTVFRLNTDGSLDKTFGNGGVFRYSTYQYNTNLFTELTKLYRLEDGSFIISGYEKAGADTYIILLKISKDGVLDTTFGNNGFTKSLLGSSIISLNDMICHNNKLYFSGRDYNGAFIYSLNLDGSFNTDFNLDGKYFLNNEDSYYKVFQKLKIVNDKIYAFGNNSTNSNQFLLVNALYLDGNTDFSFGSNGVFTTSFGQKIADVLDVEFKTESKILLITSGDFVMIDKFGNLDSTFGSNGIMTNPFGGYFTSADILPYENGYFMSKPAYIGTSTNEMAFHTINVDSDFKKSVNFGLNGEMITNVSQPNFLEQNPAKTLILKNGNIVVAGSFTVIPNTNIPTIKNQNYVVLRYSNYFNTISGDVKIDINKDGCDLSDSGFNNLKINLSKNDNYSESFTTDSEGNFKTYVDSGNYTITPILENLNYYTVSPSSATVNFADINNNVFTQNFCITPIANKNDLNIEIIPKIQARPGFETEYQIIYKNKGTTTLSGNVLFAFNDDKINYISSDTTPNSVETGKLTFNFTDLKPFEEKTIKLILKINPPTDANFPVNGGDILSYSAQVFPIADDETPRDNTFALRQEVVNSVDPNDKTCLEGDIITPDLVGNDVHYLIRFENVGTANAVNVVVKDMIDTTKFDVESLQPIKSSHPYRMTITEGNKVEFFFENIQLPFDDANNDGYILFKIKTKPTLVVGNTFSNKADIYFDYNFPIATNEAITTVQNSLSTQEFSKSEISVYPNPVKDILTFKTSEKIKKAEIYDTNGRLVKVELGISNNQIDVSSLKTGTYVIKVISDKKYYQTKLIKQ